MTMKKVKKKKYTKRIPLPKKPPKVEIPKEVYSRKKIKKNLKDELDNKKPEY
jgi:hypothetical protein